MNGISTTAALLIKLATTKMVTLLNLHPDGAIDTLENASTIKIPLLILSQLLYDVNAKSRYGKPRSIHSFIAIVELRDLVHQRQAEQLEKGGIRHE